MVKLSPGIGADNRDSSQKEWGGTAPSLHKVPLLRILARYMHREAGIRKVSAKELQLSLLLRLVDLEVMGIVLYGYDVPG